MNKEINKENPWQKHWEQERMDELANIQEAEKN